MTIQEQIKDFHYTLISCISAGRIEEVAAMSETVMAKWHALTRTINELENEIAKNAERK